MDTTDLPTKLLDLLTLQISPGIAWAPQAGAVVLAVVGLVFLIKGAKLAPVLIALLSAGLCALAGSLVTCWLPVPLWPTVAVAGILGLVLALKFSKVLFALLMTICLVTASLGLYGGHVLERPIQDYFSKGLDLENESSPVSLLDPDEALPAQLPLDTELSGLWTHLGESVPTFKASLVAIVLTTALAGLIFGLLLPKAARAFWAATVGTGLLLPAVYVILHGYWPAGAAWLGRWSVLVAALLWGLSLVYNLNDITEKRPKKADETEEKPQTA
ncbi:MAG: hypothetical protein KAY37_04020 [Phycisphaerae bacterium]|nr:hypothetical protein [Phycisphaerae bacterium]